MTFFRFGFHFDGCYANAQQLAPAPGVYVIWSPTGAVLDVGEAEDVRHRTLTHDRRLCWQWHSPWGVYYSATYTTGGRAPRLAVEALIREATKPFCGER